MSAANNMRRASRRALLALAAGLLLYPCARAQAWNTRLDGRGNLVLPLRQNFPTLRAAQVGLKLHGTFHGGTVIAYPLAGEKHTVQRGEASAERLETYRGGGASSYQRARNDPSG